MSISDPRDDVEGNNGHANYAAADILEATAEHRGVQIVLSLLVDQPTDPNTTANWESATTFAGWHLDTDDDSLFDYLVVFRRNDSGPVGVDVYRVATGSVSCTGTATLGAHGEFVATVPAGCVGSPLSFRWVSFMSWDTPEDSLAVRAHDNAPENGAPHAGPVGAP